ncbi:glycerol uptake operon antiterminator [Spirochaetia bacterium]|nr:glycerol uptake operon antiterminator [Spirochaetia bacterium]GHV92109.1 glycerol uptake operon antiterminator [Spirochaetia bacterium]
MKSILIKKKRGLEVEAFYDLLHKNPVILSVKSMEGLEKCLAGNGQIIFILFGDIITIPGIVARIKDTGKVALIHIDLIEGLSAREVAVEFLWEHTLADGILSTKPNLIKQAKQLGFITIQRFFVLDSMALLNIEKQFPLEYADVVEILPGVMPKVISRVARSCKKPIIAGGLIADGEDVQTALAAGAVSVSSTNIGLIQS